jgi:uncharacterized protein YcbK (DUF882 family)
MDQLDIIREAYGAPIVITSGFRSWDLNKAVGGSTTSQHAAGQAADMVGYDNQKLWDTIIKLNK